MNQGLKDNLRENPPKFHYWDGDFRVGGFGPVQLDLIDRCLNSIQPNPTVVESGAGLSTVWLLASGSKVHSFVADQEVANRIGLFLDSYPELKANWTCHVGFSEMTLPLWALAAERPKVDICLIDGGHSLHTVFVDFVYMNLNLKKAGFLIIDDLQLGSVALLREVLNQSFEFSEFEANKKLAAYKKNTESELLPDWKSQEKIIEKLSKLLQSESYINYDKHEKYGVCK